jgi:hypothetical protein
MIKNKADKVFDFFLHVEICYGTYYFFVATVVTIFGEGEDPTIVVLIGALIWTLLYIVVVKKLYGVDNGLLNKKEGKDE